MNDLVSGLLTKLSEVEKEALSISAGRFMEGMAGRRVDPDLNRYLDTICDPDEVLRLCRAHRQIVELWQEAEKESNPPEVLILADEMLRALAVGLGVVEEDQ